MATLLVVCLALASATDGPDTIVVCPPQLQAALKPWLQYRQDQGHRIFMIHGGRSAGSIRADIRRAARDCWPQYLLIVGDATPDGHALGIVPTGLVPAKVNVRFGSEPQIATDNWYADLDDDGVPELAIGRLPADTPGQLAMLIRRIVDYEQHAGWGLWRRRVNLIAGVGGFGRVIDRVLETATRKFLTDGFPPGWQVTMTYASWQSPYCPDPRRFRQTVIERFNEGCQFWVYVGHGGPFELDSLRLPVGQLPIFSIQDAGRLQAREGIPIALLLSCYAGAFDRPQDCLAERMLCAPGGPVAVLCASRVTMPYGMAVLGDALLKACFSQRPETLGQLLLVARQQMVQPQASPQQQQPSNRQMLDALASALSPTADVLDQERAEHVQLFNLLGDPLLKLCYGDQVTLNVARQVPPGDTMIVQGTTPLAGRCTVELVCRRGQFTFRPTPRTQFDVADAVLAGYDQTYRQANDGRWAATSLVISKGSFETRLHVPAAAHGLCRVRAFVEGADGYAMGAADVRISSPVSSTGP